MGKSTINQHFHIPLPQESRELPQQRQRQRSRVAALPALPAFAVALAAPGERGVAGAQTGDPAR